MVGEGDGRELEQIRASRSQTRTHVVTTAWPVGLRREPRTGNKASGRTGAGETRVDADAPHDVAERPKPVVKPKPKPKPAPSSPTSWKALWAPYPAWVRDLAYCIARHESWNAGLWRAVNPNTRISTASGFAQWTNPTWAAQTDRAGVGQGYSRAMYAPAAVQVEVFAYQVMKHGAYPWVGTHCGYGT